jgi:formyltetrahydrofolate-dependent phosphoribosylglycinamide formyltransferase
VTRARIAVLASGGGTNLQALADHLAALGESRRADIVLVASDRPGAGALERAARLGVERAVVATPRAPEGEELPALLARAAPDLLVLAGYLRLVPAEVIARWRGRIVNVHPGPLPAFGGSGMYGARVHRAVLDAGVPMSGPTVHLVDEIYDHGATIAHWPVPVLAGDDEQRLAARVLRAEHLLLPRVVQRLASGAPEHDVIAQVLSPFDPELDDASLARQLDLALAS